MAFLALHFAAPYVITQPQRNGEATTPEQLQLPYTPLAFITQDSIQLNGYWTKSEQDSSKGILILVHGIGGCKEHFLGLAKELSQMGIDALLFDGRAHGQSGGEFCTYGFKEKEDIAQLVDYIQQRQPDLPIGIWGNSLGGAIALQALELDERIQFGLVESTFTDLGQIVFDYKKRILKGFGWRFLSDYALYRAGVVADFEPDQVRPIDAVRHIEQPVFIAHGDADNNISYRYSEQLFANLKSKDKTFYLVKDAGHFGLFYEGGTPYKDSLMQFINRQLE